MSNDRLFGVDGNFYLHRVVHTQSFEPADEALSQAKRFVGMICKDAGAVGARRIFVGFDGDANFRFDVYDGYKGNREPGSGVYDHLPYIIGYLKKAGIPCVQKPKYEADDLMRSLIHSGANLAIGCRDKDALQGLVRDDVFLYDSSGGKGKKPTKIYRRDVKALFGVEPEQCVDYQTLIGDKIDCVPQLMSPNDAAKGLNKYGSIKEWAARNGQMMAWCRKHEKALNRNRKLVRLKTSIKIEVPPIKWCDDEDMTKSYHEFRKLATIKTRGLFG